MAITNLRTAKSFKRSRGANRPTVVFNKKEVQVIREIAARPEETKQFQYAYGNALSHTVTNDYELNYSQVFGSIARGTGPNQIVGNQIRVKGIRVDFIVRNNSGSTTAARVFGKFGLCRLNYQTTSYTTSQLLKAPDASSLVSSSYNTHTRPWNTFSGVVEKVHHMSMVNTGKQFLTSGEGIQRKTVWIPMNDKLIKFASGSTYEQQGSDLYFVWMLSGAGVGATATGIGELQFTYTVYYKDA